MPLESYRQPAIQGGSFYAIVYTPAVCDEIVGDYGCWDVKTAARFAAAPHVNVNVRFRYESS